MQGTYSSLDLTCEDIPTLGFNCPSPVATGACEVSFDSGYSASPVAMSQQMKPLTRCLPFDQPVDNQQCSDVALTFSPFKTGHTVSTVSSLHDGISLSPFKDTLDLSPFKGSPFKMHEFSPFKDTRLSPLQSSVMNSGTLDEHGIDEWENFFSNYEDKLFDIDNLDENALAEILKSPQGKALVELSPHRSKSGTHIRKIRISPNEKNSCSNKMLGISELKSEEQNDFKDVCSVTPKQSKVQHQLANTLMMEQPRIKAEPEEESEFGGFHGYSVLVATDINKMNATPVKPNYLNIERIPIRKLTMKPKEPNPEPQKENFAPPIWPSKERLKFARAQFQKTLEKAVHNVQILQEKNQHAENNSRLTQDKYPQLKRALSRPSKSTRKVKGKGREHPDKDVASTSLNTRAWNDEEEETWLGHVPFKRHASQGFSDNSDMDEEDSDDDYFPERPSQPRRQKKSKFVAKRARYV